ncbi:MAG: hypothetical protein C0P75_013510, partial [Bacilli bacterium]
MRMKSALVVARADFLLYMGIYAPYVLSEQVKLVFEQAKGSSEQAGEVSEQAGEVSEQAGEVSEQ